MAKIIERALSKEQFSEVCKAAIPHLTALAQLAKDNGQKGTMTIYIGDGGYISMGGCFDGWELHRLNGNDEFTGSFEYRESFDIRGTEVRSEEKKES